MGSVGVWSVGVCAQEDYIMSIVKSHTPGPNNYFYIGRIATPTNLHIVATPTDL